MTERKLDLRDVPPPERHPKIFETFEGLDGGERLTLVNDHDPKPLYYQMEAEVPESDPDAYEVERVGPNEFVATIPKK
ncbi:DUF2249 domain-containing protein [Halopelagius fulvigenes]|uniref:DUF2249 domain-containing protein n=1 Tax=Halopelagius fulvigenes TaxID=1198324 RepID=A0ABD5U1E3_9EURY